MVAGTVFTLPPPVPKELAEERQMGSFVLPMAPTKAGTTSSSDGAKIKTHPTS
jgi:hypothetical protein